MEQSKRKVACSFGGMRNERASTMAMSTRNTSIRISKAAFMVKIYHIF